MYLQKASFKKKLKTYKKIKSLTLKQNNTIMAETKPLSEIIKDEQSILYTNPYEKVYPMGIKKSGKQLRRERRASERKNKKNG